MTAWAERGVPFWAPRVLRRDAVVVSLALGLAMA